MKTRFTAAKAIRWGLMTTLILSLAACAGAPKKQGLSVSIQAAEDVNPDQQGRPSPIVVYVIELKSAETFKNLDFAGLTNASGAALGADRLNSTQTVVSPGGMQMLALEIDPSVTVIGVVAGYRDIDNATWRQAVPVVPGKTDNIVVQLGQFQMSTSTTN